MRRTKNQLADEYVYVTKAEASKLGLALPNPHCDGEIYERSVVMLARYKQAQQSNQNPDTPQDDVWPSYWFLASLLVLYVALCAVWVWAKTRK